MRPVGRYAEFVGIEDLTVDGADCRSGNCLVNIGQSYGCWVRNVTVRNGERRLIGIDGSLQCEITHSNIYGRKVEAQPNSGGLFLSMSTGCLIEDDIVSPGTEVDGGSAGNVFAYNFCDDASVQGGLLGISIDTNHAPHNSFNLYEGNLVPTVPERRLLGQRLARHRVPELVPRKLHKNDAVVGLRKPEPLHAGLQHRGEHPGKEGIRLGV